MSASSKSAPSKFAPSNVAPVITAFTNLTLDKSALSKTTLSTTALVISAPAKFAPTAYALLMTASCKFAPFKIASARRAPDNVLVDKSLFVKSQNRKSNILSLTAFACPIVFPTVALSHLFGSVSRGGSLVFDSACSDIGLPINSKDAAKPPRRTPASDLDWVAWTATERLQCLLSEQRNLFPGAPLVGRHTSCNMFACLQLNRKYT
mmetsp:Transcript_11930/g.23952  ORF Transcript_11930/g.23952 Transcript_11930/m.23952 type:complete len:207 (-) Transcript_11930:37-657(-)